MNISLSTVFSTSSTVLSYSHCLFISYHYCTNIRHLPPDVLILDRSITFFYGKWPITSRYFELCKWDGCQLVGVEGSPIPVVGVADVEVFFSGVNVWAEFIAAKTLNAEAILGLDFLQQNHCIINAKQRVLHLKGRALALSNTSGISKTTFVDAKAVLYESLCLPPLSEVEVMVKINSETAPLPMKLLIIVANALVKPTDSNKEITVPIRLINPSTDSVTLHKGSTVACVSVIDPSNVVENVNHKRLILRDATQSVNNLGNYHHCVSYHRCD